MAAAVFQNSSADIEARNTDAAYLLRASSSVNVFPGFITVYSESKDNAVDEAKGSLPQLVKGEQLRLIGLFPEQRFTQPPSRFTEATLIKALEQWGIGRPSTYAPILSTIQEREYVNREKGSFQPTELGILITDLLTQYFPEIVDVKFTAILENKLDTIANKRASWLKVVQTFYTPFARDLQHASHQIEKVKIADELTDEVCPECGKPLAIKTGRFGKFLACSGYPDCKYTKSYQLRLGIKCPECGGELIQRKSKKKRIFYGCSNYPKCTFATNRKPLPEPCPQCGGLLTQYGRQRAKCVKCDYIGRLSQD